jgi:choline dehydrogenase-like flavoprotein
MLSDLEDGSLPPTLSVDLCIVGAGPAGIVLAEEMRGLGLTVLLAEGGGRREDWRGRDLFDGESIGHEMILRNGRHRGLGGSAQHWGGRSAPLSPIDFEDRAWIPGSGWPFAYEALVPYYERAKRASNFVQPWLGDAAALASVGRALPKLESEDVTPFVWHYAPEKAGAARPRSRLQLGKRSNFDWGPAHIERFRTASDAHLLLHANLVALTPALDGERVTEARFKALNGREITVSARVFALCCGGLETPRALMHLDAALPGGIAGRGNLGRFFMQHPRGTILTIAPDRAQAARLSGSFGAFPRRAHGILQYEVGFALSGAAQRRHGLLNASAGLYFMPGEASAWEAAKRLRGAVTGSSGRRADLRDVGRVAGGAITAWPHLWGRYVTGAPRLLRGGTVNVIADLEQVPSPDSRLTLSDDRDALGVRRLVADWRLSTEERRTCRFFADAIAVEIQRLGLGEPKLAPWLEDGAANAVPELAGNYHFIGAARMAHSAADGVVDPNGQVFGQENLFVASSAMFPTGGHANPTLTIVALAIKLADHLKGVLA